MKAQHTPGPWRYENGEIIAPYTEYSDRSIAWIITHRDEDSNALLIAAAPEVYRLLKEAKAIIDTYRQIIPEREQDEQFNHDYNEVIKSIEG